MITPITPDSLKEKSFQNLIKEYLINVNAYVESFNSSYNKTLAIDSVALFDFLERTQEKATRRLKEIYKDSYQSKILERLNNELKSRGSIDVIKHGIKDYGVTLKLAYFKPPTVLNPEQYNLYSQNILSVTEELNYKEDKRIDLVIFLNGIPIITMELKNSFTGQTFKNAINQYKNYRDKNDQLFRFKERSIVNFAMDTDEVYMTTRLNNEETVFLPFNKGVDTASGNPSVEGRLKTHYIWEEILVKDSILDILHKFVFVEEKEEALEDGYTLKKENIIFPRYHQLDVVRKLLSDVKVKGSGNKYLIQHSAGSGKSNSIAWLAHRLASLHDDINQIIFNGVIVVTDRRVLDQQLQDLIYKLEHKIGLVAKIDDNSAQLAEELEKGTKIIISTIQKFPYILDKLSATKGNKYAIIIDEAHSSTSGKNIMALRESLSLEEAAEIASQEEAEETDTEDKINKELERFVDTSNISFFGFTATPKPATLRLFGSQGEDGKYYPFHIYSMRQAIEEGFILDVLKNYITYDMYYNVNKKIEEDPSLDKRKAAASIVRFVTLHPHNISQKTEVIVEHFKNYTMKKIGGEAKAMLVTASRLHAVRYKLAFDEYIKKKGYYELKTLVAFSGTVKDGEAEYKENQMNNGVSESQLPSEFDKEENRVLIVANKYQTGFDQPKLHTMYVDKKLSGVKAVQTLSRLNRIYPGKEDTLVLDFVNDPQDILESFMPFYKTSILENDIDPNEIYTIYRTILEEKVIDIGDVDKFCDIYYKEKHSHLDTSIMNNCIDNSINRTKSFSRDELLEFRALIKKFLNLYNLIIQIAPLVDVDLHKLNIFLRFFIKKMDIEAPSPVDITDKVLLQYYKLKKGEDLSLELDTGDDTGLAIKVGGSSVAESEEDQLSNIINRLNERHGTDFSNSEKLAVEQIIDNLTSNEDLGQKARVNTYDDFKHAFTKNFDQGIVEEYSKNTKFYGKLLRDQSFKSNLMDMIMFDIYEKLRSQDAV